MFKQNAKSFASFIFTKIYLYELNFDEVKKSILSQMFKRQLYLFLIVK